MWCRRLVALLTKYAKRGSCPNCIACLASGLHPKSENTLHCFSVLRSRYSEKKPLLQMDCKPESQAPVGSVKRYTGDVAGGKAGTTVVGGWVLSLRRSFYKYRPPIGGPRHFRHGVPAQDISTDTQTHTYTHTPLAPSVPPIAFAMLLQL